MLILRWLINAAALLVTSRLVPGFEVESFYIALIVALILGLVNAVIRPILVILTLPITLVTLGLFIFVINALMILFVSSFIQGFEVAGFGPAIGGAIILWLISLITNVIFLATHERK